jgi:hypothetical protein
MIPGLIIGTLMGITISAIFISIVIIKDINKEIKILQKGTSKTRRTYD